MNSLRHLSALLFKQADDGNPMSSIWDSEGRKAPKGLPPNAIYNDPIKGAAVPTGPYGVRVDPWVQKQLAARGYKGPYVQGYSQVPLPLWQRLSANIKNRNDTLLSKGLAQRYGIKTMPPGASELAYQAGPEGALKFEKSWGLVRDFLGKPTPEGIDPIIEEFKNSLWYRQTPTRGDKVLDDMRRGYTGMLPPAVATQPAPLNKEGASDNRAMLYHYVLSNLKNKTTSQLADEIRASGEIRPGDEVEGTEEKYADRPKGRGREPGMVYLTPHELDIPGAERFDIPVDSLPGEALVQAKARKYPMTSLSELLSKYKEGEAQSRFDKAKERRFKTLLQIVHKGAVPLS